MTDKDLAPPLRRRPVAGRRPRGRAGDRGRPPGHLDRRGDRGHPHAAGARQAPAAVPDAPPGLAAGRDRAARASARVIVGCSPCARCRTHAQRGTGAGQGRQADAGGHQDRLGRRAPPPTPTTRSATTTEHSDEASRAVDRDDGTAWTTESYDGRHRGRGQGRASASTSTPSPRSRPSQMQIETPEPGWKATIYAAPPGAVPEDRARGLDEGRRRHGHRARTSASSSTPAASRTATTSSGSPSSPPGAERPRSPRSGCSRRSPPRTRATACARRAKRCEREREQPVAELRERRCRRPPTASGRRSSW